jgi:CoA:oxalate CoA-transferase
MLFLPGADLRPPRDPLGPEFLARLAAVLGHPQLADDPRFLTNHDRVENALALQQEIERALSAKTSHEWLSLLDEAGVPNAPLNTIANVMDDPQVKARNMIVTAEDPDLGPIRMQGNPLKFSSFADPVTRPPAPDLDGDRAAILSWLQSKA